MEDENTQLEVTENPRKRPKKGRKRDSLKKARLSGHVTGRNCECKDLKCFEQVSENEQSRIIDHFNQISTKDEQDCFLAGLMNIKPVERRRSRKEDKPAFQRDCTCQYFVNVSQDSTFTKIQVCVKAFCSFFGIKKARVRRIRESLSKSGKNLLQN